MFLRQLKVSRCIRIMVIKSWAQKSFIKKRRDRHEHRDALSSAGGVALSSAFIKLPSSLGVACVCSDLWRGLWPQSAPQLRVPNSWKSKLFKHRTTRTGHQLLVGVTLSVRPIVSGSSVNTQGSLGWAESQRVEKHQLDSVTCCWDPPISTADRGAFGWQTELMPKEICVSSAGYESVDIFSFSIKKHVWIFIQSDRESRGHSCEYGSPSAPRT